jgi:hypothetical protein
MRILLQMLMKWNRLFRHHREVLAITSCNILHLHPPAVFQAAPVLSDKPAPQFQLRWSSASATCSTPPEQSSHIVISFYKFLPIFDPSELKERFASLMRELEGRGRIYINRVGINAQFCIPSQGWKPLMTFLNRELAPDLDLKTQASSVQVFNRVRIRHGKLVEGLDEQFDASRAGKHLGY